MTECLRGLERDGLVTRRIFAQVPVRVEYNLTPLGWTTTDAIVALSDWAKDHGSDVTRARSDFWHRRADTDLPVPSQLRPVNARSDATPAAFATQLKLSRAEQLPAIAPHATSDLARRQKKEPQ